MSKVSGRVLETFGIESVSPGKQQKDSGADSGDVSNLLGDVKDYTEQLRGAWKGTCGSVNRNAVFILVLMAIFELLAYQGKTQTFTIGSFTFANTSIVQLCLPSIVAFLVLDLYILTSRAGEMENVHAEIMEHFASKIHTSGLDLLIAPSLVSFWAPTNTLPREVVEPPDRLREVVTGVLAIVSMMLIPVAFEIQAYYHLFAKFGFWDPLLWANVVITSILACCSAAFIIMGA